MKEISIFGEKAREIQEGQIFKARIVNTEQGDKVVLDPVIFYDKDGGMEYEIRHE